MKKAILVVVLICGCASKNTTVNANRYGDDTEDDASTNDSSVNDSSNEVYNDLDSGQDIEIECLPGGEIIGNTCYYPEPNCCIYQDCPEPIGEYSCVGGNCIRYTQPKECKNDSCQQYCVNCWVSGNKNYIGVCNGNTCECEAI